MGGSRPTRIQWPCAAYALGMPRKLRPGPWAEPTGPRTPFPAYGARSVRNPAAAAPEPCARRTRSSIALPASRNVPTPGRCAGCRTPRCPVPWGHRGAQRQLEGDVPGLAGGAAPMEPPRDSPTRDAVRVQVVPLPVSTVVERTWSSRRRRQSATTEATAAKSPWSESRTWPPPPACATPSGTRPPPAGPLWPTSPKRAGSARGGPASPSHRRYRRLRMGPLEPRRASNSLECMSGARVERRRP